MLVAINGQYSEGLLPRIAELYPIAELNELSAASRGEVGILITRGKLRVDTALFDQFPNLRLIVKAGAGLDTIDLQAAATRKVVVRPTGGSASSVAELALALLMNCLRKIPLLDSAVRAGNWGIKEQFLGDTVSSRRIGIIGFGSIGQAFASMTSCLGAQLCVWDRSLEKPEKSRLLEKLRATPCGDLRDLVAFSDVISIHLPLMAETECLLGRNELSAMNEGSILINTARAAIVDQKALVDSLCRGPLAAAGLDVHYSEGKATDDPLVALRNVVLTPHVGAQTRQAHRSIADRIVAIVSDYAKQ